MQSTFNQEKKTKQKHNKTTINNNNKRIQKRKKRWKLLQISSVCKPCFFTKHHSKNKRKITGFSDGSRNKTAVCEIFTHRSRITARMIQEQDKHGRTTSDCSDREIVPIRNPRVILSRPEAGKWWLELNVDEIFV